MEEQPSASASIPSVPPASPPPPPVIPAPSSHRPPKPGRGWKILAIVLLVLLGIIVLSDLASLSGSGGTGHGPQLEEVVLEKSPAREKIAVIEVSGVIASESSRGFGMVDVLRAQFDRAREDKRVKAVVLKVDSPGGEVLASDEIYRIIADFQDKSGKPVIASMGNVAASGGYYVSAPCRWIVANQLTITGSIGVIMQTFNYRGLMNKVGVAPYTFKSGQFKDMLSGSRELAEIPAAEREMLESMITEIYSRFQTVVAEGRKAALAGNEGKGKALAENWKEYADGRVMSGSEALRLGFVDELGNYKTAVDRALALAGIGKATLIGYEQPAGLADFLRVFGKSEATVLKVDVGLEFPKLRAGQPYFLAPNFAH